MGLTGSDWGNEVKGHSHVIFTYFSLCDHFLDGSLSRLASLRVKMIQLSVHVSDDPLPEDIPEARASTREDAQMDQSQSDCSDLTLGKVCFIFHCKYSPPSPRLLSITCGNINNFLGNLRVRFRLMTSFTVMSLLNVLSLSSGDPWHESHLTEIIMWNRTKCLNCCHKYLPPVSLTHRYRLM